MKLKQLLSMRALLFFCWTLFASSALATEVSAQLLLQDSPLAGFQFHAGKKLWSQMRVGDGLMLVREPDNVYDRLAIRVEWKNQAIGYVPRRENSDVARLLDHGVKLVARISRLAESRDPWARVRFEILAPLAQAQ
jgi:hypothetical protein